MYHQNFSRQNSHIQMGDFSRSNQMDGLWDTITNAAEKAYDSALNAIQNNAASATDKLLNDQIAKLLGTGATATQTGNTVNVTGTIPGQTTYQYVPEQMSMNTKIAIGAGVGFAALMLLITVMKSKSN